MTIHTNFFLAILSLMLAQSALSQTDLSAAQMAAYQDKLMFEALNLTEEQQAGVSRINLKYSKKQKALMDEPGSMFGKIGDIKRIKKAKNAELEAVLTAAQFEKYEDDIAPKIKSYMKANMKS